MNKKALLLLLGALLLTIFCGFLNCEKQTENDPPESDNKEIAQQTGIKGPQAHSSEPGQALGGGRGNPQEEGPNEEKPITQYDSKALDDKVIEQARLLNIDPKTHRMLVRKDPDGAEIYRMLGMHVIANPNGEEAYLPDEI